VGKAGEPVQVRIRQNRIKPVKKKIRLGNHAERFGGSAPPAPIASAIRVEIIKRMVVAKANPIAVVVPPLLLLWASGIPKMIITRHVNG